MTLAWSLLIAIGIALLLEYRPPAHVLVILGLALVTASSATVLLSLVPAHL